MEIRRDNLNPDARIEMAKLNDYIRATREILAGHDIRLNMDGLLLGSVWSENPEQGPIYPDRDLFGLLSGQEPDTEQAMIAEEQVVTPDGKEEELMSFTLSANEATDYERRKEIIMERKRMPLERFDVKVYAYLDRVELRGLLPTESFKWGSISSSACG